MWKTIWGYLTFTRKERIGVLFLLLLMSVLFCLPFFFKPAVGSSDPEAYEKMKSAINRFEQRTKDSVGWDRKEDLSVETSHLHTSSANATLSPFDPNYLDLEGWRKLGISDRVAGTIMHYLERGGIFRKPDDLKKIYGLHRADYDRVFPFIRIGRREYSKRLPESVQPYHYKRYNQPDSTERLNTAYSIAPAQNNFFYRKKKSPVSTDINLADSAAWCGLPGIGEKLAARILRFREKLGGFYHINQVAETYGLPDSVFQLIKPYLVMSSSMIRRIDLNTASQAELQAHPYIRWKLSREMITFREQHGRFDSLEEILQLGLVDTILFQKIRPYLLTGTPVQNPANHENVK